MSAVGKNKLGRNIYVGPRGGSYVMVGGKKKYGAVTVTGGAPPPARPPSPRPNAVRPNAVRPSSGGPKPLTKAQVLKQLPLVDADELDDVWGNTKILGPRAVYLDADMLRKIAKKGGRVKMMYMPFFGPNYDYDHETLLGRKVSEVDVRLLDPKVPADVLEFNKVASASGYDYGAFDAPRVAWYRSRTDVGLQDLRDDDVSLGHSHEPTIFTWVGPDTRRDTRDTRALLEAAKAVPLPNPNRMSPARSPARRPARAAKVTNESKVSCIRIAEGKWSGGAKRGAPPFHAKPCAGTVKQGLDGRMWRSAPSGKTFRWVVLKA